MDCLAADTMPVFFDPHLTAVMPFSDVVDFAEFTEYIDPEELQGQQANAIDVIQVRFSSLACRPFATSPSTALSSRTWRSAGNGHLLPPRA